MYEDMMKDVKENMKPVVDMAEINKKAAEKLIELQSGYVSDFVNATMAQMQALSAVTDPQKAIDLQVAYVKQLEEKLTSVAEEEMATLNTAKEELTAIIGKSFEGMSLKDVNYFEGMSKFVTPAATEEAPVKPSTPKKAAAPAKPAAKKSAPVKKAAAPKKEAPAKTAAPKKATAAPAPKTAPAKAEAPAKAPAKPAVKTEQKPAAAKS